MWQLLMATVRPISLLAWIPVVVGSWLTDSLGCPTAIASVGAVLALSLINLHNNQTDRKLDRLNLAKKTLAVKYPLIGWQLVLFLAPIGAIVLRQVGYNYLLLSVIFFVGIGYNYWLGRLPIIKRIVVATEVAALAFLSVERTTPHLWLLASFIWLFIYVRETRKDQADLQEDKMGKFLRLRGALVDYWCLSAPFLGSAIYLAASLFLERRFSAQQLVISLGTALTIFSFMQIRSRHGWYKMPFPHRLIAGQAGLSLALSALMPPFARGLLMVIVLFNLISIYLRSSLSLRANLSWLANLHDGYLWASLIIQAMISANSFPSSLVTTSILLMTLIFIWERYRTQKFALCT